MDMRILDEVIRVITQSPGNLVYFLVTLFALQQAFVAALTAYRSAPALAHARRWLWATGGMLVGRVGLIVLGLLGVGGVLSPADFVPPFERWLLVASVAAFIWAALLGAHSRPWQTMALASWLVITGLAFGADTLFRARQGVSLAAEPFVWQQAVVLVTLLVSLVLNLVLRVPEREWSLSVTLFWLLGTVAQLVWRDPTQAVDGWQRLASLVALPLLSMLVPRQLQARPLVASRRSGSLLEGVPLAEVIQSVSGSRNLESTLIVASSRLAGLLHADVCAIGLVGEEVPDEVRVVAVHPPNSAQIDPPHLRLADYEGLDIAYAQGRAVVAASSAEDPWVAPLYQALGFSHTAPLAIVPVAQQQHRLGLLLLGGPQGARSWREDALDAAILVGDLLGEAIAQARSRVSESRAMASRVQEAVEVGAEAKPVVGQQNAERIIEQAKVQVQALNARIRSLVQEIKARDEEILALNSELDGRKADVSQAELEVWQNEVRQLADEREVMQRKIKELTVDRDMLLEERARLGQELSEARQELEQVESHRARLEDEVAALNTRIGEAGAHIVTQTTQPESLQAGSVAHEDAVTEQGAVGLVIADQEGQITMADALARQMLHLPEGDVVGMPINGAYADAEWSRAVDALLAPSNGRGPGRTHLSLVVDNGSIEADLAALQGRDGRVDGLVITLRTPESDAERREALVSLVNDFRTPMTAITGYTDLLLGEQAGILTGMQHQFLERVKANVEQLNHLLNDLIQTSSPDSRPVELSPQPVNLIEIIEEAIMGLAARFRERKLAVQLDLPQELSRAVADRDSLYQIMLRLLSNAALCSAEGTQIVVSAEETDGEMARHVRVSVTDTGGGINPVDYSRVFRRLFRANQPLVQGMGETGVGIAMAKTLVEANGGRIWVESEEGVGSTFSFLLPAAETPQVEET